MKSIRYVLTAAALVCSMAYLQAQQAQGESVANLGIGLASSLTGEASLPPLSLAYDYGYSDNISIGGYLGYASAKDEFALPGASYSWTYTYLIVGVRGAYHHQFIDGVDTYGGVLVGYNVASASFEGTGINENLVPEPSIGGLAWAGFVGARYYFTESLGGFAELGYGISLVNLGLCLKL